MKLFTIGDSISQGFMSGAAAHTDLCYSTLIAKCMGLNPGRTDNGTHNYFYPLWPEGGLPAPIEPIMRALNERYGTDISGLEWFTLLSTINKVIDPSEDYYERGEGRADKPYPGGMPFFHNVSVRDFDVADAWMVTPEICRKYIREADRKFIQDGFLTGASAPLFRTALKVLSPNLNNNRTQVDWLKFHAENQGVDNLLLWLGANNALKTVMYLKIQETPNDPARRPCDMGFDERLEQDWNLWHPADFKAEYIKLLDKIDAIMAGNKSPDWKVFVGTVPYVTAIPLIKGSGEAKQVEGMGTYYDYYTYFPFNEEFAEKTGVCLKRDDVLKIDLYINEYNKAIGELVDARPNFHLVDICSTLAHVACQRNMGKPGYHFPQYFNTISPKVDARYYYVDSEGTLKRGGLFGLDGIHPSAIGQGLVALEFMNRMKDAGVVFESDLDWPSIFASDSLYSSPITIMQELWGHQKLARHIVNFIQRVFRRQLQDLLPRTA